MGNIFEFEVSQGGGPPAGNYRAVFEGVEQTTHEEYGDGLRWKWKVTDGPQSGVIATRTIKLSNVGTGVVASSGYLGVAGQGIFIWGAQMETGAYATSYIPTTTATVTRNADSATISTGFSSWFNAAEGTMFSSSLLARQNTDAGLMFFEVSNGTVNQALRCFSRSTGSSGFSVVATAVSQADLNPNIVIAANTSLKIAAAYAVNNFGGSFNGGDTLTDTAGSLPTGINQASIGSGTTGTILNGTIARVAYWPTRLSDSILRRLSR